MRVQQDHWKPWRDARLQALADTPSAFSSTLEAERAYDDDVWIERCRTGSAGFVSGQFAATDASQDGFVAMVAIITSALTEHCAAGEAELVSMWTAPEARGHGVGQALVQACIDWAHEAPEIGAIGLWVLRGNAPAERLYERCGFELTGDHQPLPSDPCKDEIRMKLTL